MNIPRDRLVETLEHATGHRRTDNRHARRALRWAGADMGDAALLLRLLSARSGAILRYLDESAPAHDAGLLGTLLRSDGTLVQPYDMLHLMSAVQCAQAAAGDELWWAEGQVPTCVLQDPVAVVHNAYMLLRDLMRMQTEFLQRRKPA